MSDGQALRWVDNIRYLGVFISCPSKFSCSFDSAKRSFHRSFNAIFGKVGRAVSEEVVLHLVKTKCLPILVYALEACPTNRTLERSLEFPFTKILMKIFRTRCKDTVTECSYNFGLQCIADLIKKRKLSFLLKFVSSPNSICQLFVSVALCETKLLKTQ